MSILNFIIVKLYYFQVQNILMYIIIYTFLTLKLYKECFLRLFP